MSRMTTAALALMLVITGCSREIDGVALGDPAPPQVQITDDGFGIQAGLADAPVQLELFTEPQCTHCADLQEGYGDQFAYYIAAGQLALTYRPLTFLDDEYLSDEASQGHSARVVNAMFTAAASSVTGRQFQRFVEALWANQEPGTPGPSDQELAELARGVGIPDAQSGRIEDGSAAMTDDERQQMETTNFEFLYQVAPVNTGTPAVFNLVTGETLDVYDDDWLAKVMES